MPSDADLHDSVERTRQAFRAAREGREFPREPGAAAERFSPDGLHPFFHGLLEALPDPGAEWPRAQRDQWLETARNIFALIYRDSQEERPPTPFHQDRPHGQFDQRTV